VKKSGLGRGLGALLEGVDSTSAPVSVARDDDAESVSHIDVKDIQRGTWQPRTEFDEDALAELAESITAQGLIQPILLRARAGGYELIAGERRWRAAQIAGLKTIPAIVREMDDSTAAAVTLIENIQREDLNPLEEARALQRLQTEFDMTHQQVAESVGRSRASVSNLLRLLDLDSRVADMLATGKIEMGHARALLSLDEEDQHAVAMKVYVEGLSVRATESLVRQQNGGTKSTSTVAKSRPSAHVKALESRLSEQLGAKVSINHGDSGKGSLKVSYNSLDELDGILAHIK
jgi:ParB family chromosome partitioning protein